MQGARRPAVGSDEALQLRMRQRQGLDLAVQQPVDPGEVGEHPAQAVGEQRASSRARESSSASGRSANTAETAKGGVASLATMPSRT